MNVFANNPEVYKSMVTYLPKNTDDMIKSEFGN